MSNVIFRTIGGRVIPIKASGTPKAPAGAKGSATGTSAKGAGRTSTGTKGSAAAGAGAQSGAAAGAGAKGAATGRTSTSAKGAGASAKGSAAAGRASASGAGGKQTPKTAGGRPRDAAFPTVGGIGGQVGLGIADRIKAVSTSASHWGTSPKAIYDAAGTATVTSRGIRDGIAPAIKETTRHYPTRSTPGLGGGTTGKLGAVGGVIGIAADTALSIDAGDSGRAAFGRAGAGFLGSVAAAGAGAKGGAAAGAAIGGAVGSVVPGAGTAAGAVAGATAGAVVGGITAGMAGAMAARKAFDAVDTRINGPNARTKGWGGQQIR